MGSRPAVSPTQASPAQIANWSLTWHPCLLHTFLVLCTATVCKCRTLFNRMLALALQMLLTYTDAVDVGAMQLHHAQGPAALSGFLQSAHQKRERSFK